jgi:hypothetical protein
MGSGQDNGKQLRKWAEAPSGWSETSWPRCRPRVEATSFLADLLRLAGLCLDHRPLGNWTNFSVPIPPLLPEPPLPPKIKKPAEGRFRRSHHGELLLQLLGFETLAAWAPFGP